MTSATVSLFASVAIATVGALGLAYTLSHPGVLVSATNRVLVAAGAKPLRQRKTAQEPMLDAQESPVSGSGISGSGTVSIAAGDYGHFRTEAEINGRAVDVMVDTGASLVALTYEDAASLGIFVNPAAFTDVAKTANGTARVAPITISRISVGDITVRNVPAVVSERGASERTLLGMSFLGRLSRVEMRGRTLVLQE
jgi:aspartyl protease family protein